MRKHIFKSLNPTLMENRNGGRCNKNGIKFSKYVATLYIYIYIFRRKKKQLILVKYNRSITKRTIFRFISELLQYFF